VCAFVGLRYKELSVMYRHSIDQHETLRRTITWEFTYPLKWN